MEKKDKTLIIVAIVICVIICVLSPEDSGLAEDFSIEEIKGIPDAIFPDYAFASSPDDQGLQVVALVVGVVITLIVGLGVAYVVKK